MPKNTWGIYYLYYLLKKTTATFRCSKQLPDGRSWPFRPVARQCAGQWLKCAFAALRNLWCIYLGVNFSGNLVVISYLCVTCQLSYVICWYLFEERWHARIVHSLRLPPLRRIFPGHIYVHGGYVGRLGSVSPASCLSSVWTSRGQGRIPRMDNAVCCPSRD